MKNVFRKYYKAWKSPEIYKFYPNINYNCEDPFENVHFSKESEKRRELLDCYKSQTIDKYRNIQLDFSPFIFL
jgi:hypothetical protein